MRYLLDTTVVIPVLAGDHDAIGLVRRLASDGVAVSILSYLEAYQGVVEASDPEAARRVFNALFLTIPVLSVSVAAVARRCAELRAMLRKAGRNPRRGAFDLVIAATALEHVLEQVTHNARDFADIPDLRLRDR